MPGSVPGKCPWALKHISLFCPVWVLARDIAVLLLHVTYIYSSIYLMYASYRMAGNFRGIQFSRKAHLQRFRDLIFADGRSRVAPPTISARLHLLLHARRGSNLVGTSRKKNQQAIDRSYLYLAEIEKWHESSI